MTTMTDQNVNEFIEAVESENKDNESIQNMKKVKEMSIDEMLDGEEKKKNVRMTINPSTGLPEGTSIAAGYGYDKDNDIFDDFLDDDDLKPADTVDTDFSEEQIKDVLGGSEIHYEEATLADIYAVKDLLIKKNETGEVKYADLPDFLQKRVDRTVRAGMGSGALSGSHFRTARNMLANEIMETIYTEVVNKKFEEICVDLNTSIQNLAKKESAEIRSAQHAQHMRTFVVEMPRLAKEKYADDPEKSKLLLDISDGYKQAHSLEKMYDRFCKGGKQMKIRHIDLENPDKVIDEFKRKYVKSKYTVRNLHVAADVLCRHVNKRFSRTTINAFVITFCKYVRDMTPANVDEHTFMYYFIDNVLSLDIPTTNKDDVSYNEEFIDNVNHFMTAISDRYHIDPV